MKSIKRIVMIGIMTVASISMFIGTGRAESPGPFTVFISNGPSQSAGPAGTPGYRCPLYDQTGAQVGFSEAWSSDWLNPNADGTHALVFTDASGNEINRVGGVIPNSALMINEHKIDDEVLNAFPEVEEYVSSQPTKKCRILTVASNEGGGGHIDVRCTFLVCDGVFVRCLKCMYVIS